MWHRIVDGQIVESIEQFGDVALREMTPGELRERFGWVHAATPPLPVFNPDEHTPKVRAVYHTYTGEVTEQWALVPVNEDDPTYLPSEEMLGRKWARMHPDLGMLFEMTPQEVAAHIDSTFSGLTAAQRRTLRALAVAVRVLGKNKKLL